ncbi:MAG: hypothetical protein MI861_11265, partial [Pirellulales bacterium]|nr:hypothetical protein [Pirellulales bacterium]
AAEVRVDNLKLGSAAPVSIQTGRVTIQNGLLRADRLQIAAQDSPQCQLIAGVRAGLTGPFPLECYLRGNDISLDALTQTLTSTRWVSGKLDLDVQARGDWVHGPLAVRGRIASPRMYVAGVDLGVLEHRLTLDQGHLELVPIDRQAADSSSESVLADLSLDYTHTNQTWSIDRLSASVFGGKIQGSGKIAKTPIGNHSCDLHWQGIQPRFRLGGWNTHVTAISSGRIQLQAPARQPGDISGRADVSLKQILVRQIRIGNLRLGVDIAAGGLQSTGQGDLLGGTLAVSHRTTCHAPWADSQGQASVESMRLEELARLIAPGRLTGISGRTSAKIEFSAAGAGQTHPQSKITWTLSDLMWNHQSLARRLVVHLKTQGQEILLQRVDGSFAGGSLQASGRWSLSQKRQQLQVTFADVDVHRATLPLLPGYADKFAGKLSGNMTVTGDDPIRMRGSLSARNTQICSVPTGHFRGGFQASLSSNLKRWKLKLPSLRGQLAGGSIDGQVHLASSVIRPGTADLSSQLHAEQVDFGQVLGQISDSLSAYAHGRVTGDLTLAGRGIRHPQDLTGRFDAELGQTQSAAIPGLVSADRFLGVISLAQARFDTGRIVGFIGGGAARLEEFWLRSRRVRVFAEGTIQLANARSDLNVVISTGNFAIDNAQLASLATQLALQSVLPIAGLMELNRLLSHRTIHLDFTGPLTDPRLRLKPLEIIREEAARFLIREILVSSSLAADQF